MWGWEVVWNNCEEAALEGDSRVLTCDQGPAPEELRTAALPESPSHQICCWDILLPLGSSHLHMEHQQAGGGKEAELGLQEILDNSGSECNPKLTQHDSPKKMEQR